MTPTVRHPVPPLPPQRCWECKKPIFIFEGTWHHRGNAVHDHEAEPDPAIAMEAAFDQLMDDLEIPEEDRATYGC